VGVVFGFAMREGEAAVIFAVLAAAAAAAAASPVLRPSALIPLPPPKH